MQLSLAERDLKTIWHPYTQHKNMTAPIPVTHGKGALLFDENDNAYIDAISSWWVNIHGHAHPYIAEKIYEQAKKLGHVIFSGFTHEPAVQLAERLLNIVPGNMSKIFYSDNGSTAVEVAIKMAIQYWRNKENSEREKRNKILAFRHSYHGDTFGAMSVSERGIFTAAFDDYLFEVIFIDTPDAANLDQLKQIVSRYGKEIACFIYEPLLQAAGGMRMYDATLFDELLNDVQSQNIICIADEVMTGFGRTGKMFAAEYIKNKADMVCLSKGLTGGTMAMGVTACSQKIFDAFLSDDRMKTFFHGHSYTANPIACATALASLDLLEKKECRSRIDTIVEHHKNFSEKLRIRETHQHQNKSAVRFRNIRQLGTIIAFEIDTGTDGYLNNIGTIITQQSLKEGIYLRPLGNTVYFMPPYCISEEELNKVYKFIIRL
jgi:adenosylmethionine-8-amino-7-oxononanoate aminotransferase